MYSKTQAPENAKLVNGVFHQIIRPISKDPRPVLFLDRDGCIVVETNYLHKAEEVQLINGAANVIARANSLDIAVVVVTNQSGIGRGYFTWEDFFDVQQEIVSQLGKVGAYFDGVFACPYHEKGKQLYKHPNHPSRKPNPGMLHAAAISLNLDLSRSWIVGDRASDLGAGLNASLAGGIHVASGYGLREGERRDSLALATESFSVLAADTIADIPEMIGLFT